VVNSWEEVIVMESVSISLPDDMSAFITRQATHGGFSSVSDYLCSLILQKQNRQAKRELEAKLLEGLEGPVSELTPEDSESIEAEAMEALDRESTRP
jgi:Arc/MetJ-type ribon-helix-helix transcriptional regulator